MRERSERPPYELCPRVTAEQLTPHEPCARHHCLELAVGPLARQVLHPAVGRENETFGRKDLQRRPDPLRDRVGRFDLRRAEVERPENDGLARNFVKDVSREVRLCRLERQMGRAALVELARNG